MTAEEIFCDLFDKYGEDLNWHMVPLSQSNDDVLYVTGGEQGGDTYYIFHLTYSKQNLEGFPKYEKFADIYAVKEFIEQAFIKTI